MFLLSALKKHLTGSRGRYWSDNEEKRFTRGDGESSDEFVWRCKDKSRSWARVVRRAWGESWCAPGIRVVAIGFAIVADVVTESVRKGLMSEMLYADDFIYLFIYLQHLGPVKVPGSKDNSTQGPLQGSYSMISETMEGVREKFWKWKEAFESKGLKVNLGKTMLKVVVSGTEG